MVQNLRSNQTSSSRYGDRLIVIITSVAVFVRTAPLDNVARLGGGGVTGPAETWGEVPAGAEEGSGDVGGVAAAAAVSKTMDRYC